MKILISTLMLLFTSQAFATIVVEDVKQYEQLIPSCPICDGGPMVTTTIIEFSMISCMQYPTDVFDIEISGPFSSYSATLPKSLKVVLKDGLADCFGPASRHEYSLDTKEIRKDERILILNPTIMKASPVLEERR